MIHSNQLYVERHSCYITKRPRELCQCGQSELTVLDMTEAMIEFENSYEGL